MRKLIVLVSFFTICSGITLWGQGTISGDMQARFQYLMDDDKIGAKQPDEKALLNSFINVNYRLKGFKAGLRLEGYLPHTLGYPDRYEDVGLGYRYVGYSNKIVDVTVGNFYEQFGSGLIFRSYYDPALGVDNMMNGVNIKLRPYKGISLKAVYGKQRYSFSDGKVNYGPGLVRGVDLGLNFNALFPKLSNADLFISAGGSFVSKYQKDDNPKYILPENVGAYGGRLNIRYKKFYINGEYIIKGQDPSQENGYIYNYGKGLILHAGYSTRGLGILLSAKSIDNMGFRSGRNALLQDLTIGFIPPMTKTHTYNLVATLYPYVSQPTGEVAFQADVMYKFKRGTPLGGKYGTHIALNFSTAYAPIHSTEGLNGSDTTRVLYKSRLFNKSSTLYWSDFNVEIKKKISKKWLLKASYYNISMNNDVMHVAEADGVIQSHIGVLDVQYKINRKNTIRVELQGLWTKGNIDRGAWATGLVEYTISPHWFFSAIFQSNYGNPVAEDRINYPMVFAGYIWGATRLQIGYGRQKKGLFCVGGICRFVPASNGLTVTFSTSF